MRMVLLRLKRGSKLRIYCISLIIAVLYSAKWFYPDIFSNLNPEEVHREYFERWLRVEYRGIWAYPLINKSLSPPISIFPKGMIM